MIQASRGCIEKGVLSEQWGLFRQYLVSAAGQNLRHNSDVEQPFSEPPKSSDPPYVEIPPLTLPSSVSSHPNHHQRTPSGVYRPVF